MPFKDADVARAYQRERKRIERARGGTTPVQPDGPAAVGTADLIAAGRILGHMQSHGESDTAYRDRLRAAWCALLRVME